MASKIEHTAARLKRLLREAADPAAKASLTRFFKRPVRALGVRTPDVRRIAAAAAKEYRARGMAVDDVFDLAEPLWRGGVLEERVLAVFLIARFQRQLERTHWERLEGWASSLSNWGEADGLGIHVIGPLLRREPDLSERVHAWCESGNPLQRRAAAVSLVPLARQGVGQETVVRLCEALAEDGDDLVQKAVGWLLKELSRTDPESVTDFLVEHRERLSRLTLRYASEKLPERLRRRARARLELS